VPYGQILTILDKYSKYLKESGVFIVRLFSGDARTGKKKWRVKRKIDLIKREFNVVESVEYNTYGLPSLQVFRPRCKSSVEMQSAEESQVGIQGFS
jgi:hypothetical protein